LAIICVTSLSLTYAPIVKVEAEYRWQKTLQNFFGVNDLRALILPEFKFDFTRQSKFPQFGMSIPRLYVDEPIILNVDPNNSTDYTEALKHGIAHAAGTALPGQMGLGYYFAHSSSPEFVTKYNAVFYLIGKLDAGDEIVIWKDGEPHKYAVTNKQETSANDVSFLSRQYDRPTIVLQTCWPPGTTAKRLLVFAEAK
jgi:sortase A